MHELISENASALNHIKVRLRKKKTFFEMPIYCCLRADVSYFVCCTRKRGATKEIGDVFTQANLLLL